MVGVLKQWLINLQGQCTVTQFMPSSEQELRKINGGQNREQKTYKSYIFSRTDRSWKKRETFQRYKVHPKVTLTSSVGAVDPHIPVGEPHWGVSRPVPEAGVQQREAGLRANSCWRGAGWGTKSGFQGRGQFPAVAPPTV